MNGQSRESLIAAERKRMTAALLLAVIVMGVLVRLPGLGYSFYGDESFSLLRDSHRLITDTEDRFRPLFFSFLYLWKQIGFHGEIGLRLLPLLFGIAQIPFAYLIGVRLGERQFGLAFALLIALSPMLIEFSQELRMYSMVGFLALLQCWLLLKLIEKPKIALWIGFVIVGTAAVYTHLLYWLFLAGMSLTFLRERKRLPLWKGWSALTAVIVLYLPNLPNLAEFTAVRGGEYSMHLPSALPKLLAAFTLGFNYFTLPEQGLNRPVGFSDLEMNLPLVIIAGAAALAILWGFFRLHRRSEASSGLWLCYELFVVPVILAFAACVISHKYFLQPKYLIFAAPFALLLIALCYYQIEHKVWRRSVAAVGIFIAAVALQHFNQPQDYGRREDWRSAARILAAQLDEHTALVLIPGGYSLLRYYAPGIAPNVIYLDSPLGAEPPSFLNHVKSEIEGRREVYYLRHDTSQNLSDPQDVTMRTLDQLGRRVFALKLNPRFRLYRWKLSPPERMMRE